MRKDDKLGVFFFKIGRGGRCGRIIFICILSREIKIIDLFLYWVFKVFYMVCCKLNIVYVSVLLMFSYSGFKKI